MPVLYSPRMHTDSHRFYAVLGVDPAASDKVIRVAFRRRAKQIAS